MLIIALEMVEGDEATRYSECSCLLEEYRA